MPLENVLFDNLRETSIRTRMRTRKITIIDKDTKEKAGQLRYHTINSEIEIFDVYLFPEYRRKKIMSNAREEILSLSTDRLRNKVESIMFSINMILSNPDKCDNQIGKMSELLVELAVTESALKHAQGLLAQCIEIRISELKKEDFTGLK